LSKSKASEGKRFEENWKDSYKDLPIYYLRLRDAAKWNRGEKSTFTPENPYDSLQYKIPFLWLLELKSTKGSSISFIPEKPYEKPKGTKTTVMLKDHQVRSLMDASKKEGVIAGFIVNFRERVLKTKSEPHEVFFIHINDFLKFAKKSKKSTLNREDSVEIGIAIKSKKKKINYTYEIDRFVNESIHDSIKKEYLKIDMLKFTYDWIGNIIGKSEVTNHNNKII